MQLKLSFLDEEIVIKSVGLRSQEGGTPHALYDSSQHSSNQHLNHLAVLVYPNVGIKCTYDIDNRLTNNKLQIRQIASRNVDSNHLLLCDELFAFRSK